MTRADVYTANGFELQNTKDSTFSKEITDSEALELSYLLKKYNNENNEIGEKKNESNM